MSDDAKVEAIENVLKLYVIPNKENDGLSGKKLAEMILDAIKEEDDQTAPL